MMPGEELRRWFGDVSEIPVGICWGPRHASFEQLVVAWALMECKRIGEEPGPYMVGYIAAGLVTDLPRTGERWEELIRNMLDIAP